MENVENETEDDVSLSQMSSFSLNLSQNTLNQILVAGASGPNITEEIHIEESECNGDETNGVEGDSDISSTISIQRTLIYPSSGYDDSATQTSAYQGAHPTQYPPPSLYHSGHHSSTTPTISTPPIGSPVLSDCSPMSCPPAQSQGFVQDFTRPKIPSNVGFPGHYNFGLVLNDDEKPVPKTATFTFSSCTKRAYIRRDTTIGITFSFSTLPPNHSIIRAMAIHKAPELVGEVLQCCPKHIDEQKKRYHKFPRHFVCGTSNSEVLYCEDPITGRLSITHCTGTLQQKPGNVLQAFYVFPCFTSELHKGPGQLVQLIFTLEIGGHVVGRAILDARVCASPGRDRENDEAKLSPSVSSGFLSLSPSLASNQNSTDGQRRARKRSSSTITQNLECMLPSKIPHSELSTKKQKYTVETYPELFPFIDVCIKMMEKVHSVQVEGSASEALSQALNTASGSGGPTLNTASGSGGPTLNTASGSGGPTLNTASGSGVPTLNTGPGLEGSELDPSFSKSPKQTGNQRTFESVENWLQYIGLSQYAAVFEAHGIMLISQVLGIDEKQLIDFGIMNSQHRERLLDGLKIIRIASTPLKEEQDEAIHSYSQHSTSPFVPNLSQSSMCGPGTPLEVLRIQMKKTFSSSSSSSSGEYN